MVADKGNIGFHSVFVFHYLEVKQDHILGASSISIFLVAVVILNFNFSYYRLFTALCQQKNDRFAFVRWELNPHMSVYHTLDQPLIFSDEIAETNLKLILLMTGNLPTKGHSILWLKPKIGVEPTICLLKVS